MGTVKLCDVGLPEKKAAVPFKHCPGGSVFCRLFLSGLTHYMQTADRRVRCDIWGFSTEGH